MVPLKCDNCGITFTRSQRKGRNGRPKRFCSPKCRYAFLSGAKHANFKGGRYVPTSRTEYATVLHPGHPRAHRGRVKEHILVMEGAVGGPLPDGAEVHHLDGNKTNNVIENLYLCRDRHHHMVLEAALKRLRRSGDVTVKRCHLCTRLLGLDEFHRDKNSWDGRNNDCKRCAINHAGYYQKLRRSRA
jgi:hypothetical protein